MCPILLSKMLDYLGQSIHPIDKYKHHNSNHFLVVDSLQQLLHLCQYHIVPHSKDISPKILPTQPIQTNIFIKSIIKDVYKFLKNKSNLFFYPTYKFLRCTFVNRATNRIFQRERFFAWSIHEQEPMCFIMHREKYVFTVF